MTRFRRPLVIVAVAIGLLVGTASAATAAGRCRFIVDYSGNIVSVECDKLA